MRRLLAGIALALAWTAVGAAGAHAATRPRVACCSHDADAGELAARTFERENGSATSIARKPTGAYCARLRAERGNPKADAWYGRTVDPFPQAAPRCWSDLLSPRDRREAELANPVTSGTGYATLAPLAVLYGEDRAFAYLVRPALNVVRSTQSGTTQELANRTRHLILPANAAATIRPEAARFAQAAALDVDPMKFGQPDERVRRLSGWQREIGDAPR